MSELAELEGRISRALARVHGGLSHLSRAMPGQGPDEFARLEAALDEEKLVNAQLQERVRALKEKQEQALAEAERKFESQHKAVAELDGEMQGLRQTNAELREITAQMRRALAEQLAEPELVNRAMQAELDALAAARDSEIAEADAILAELGPLIEGAR